MIRINNDIYSPVSSRKRKEKKGTYLNAIEKEIKFLEHRIQLRESLWNKKIKEALIKCPLEALVPTKETMIKQMEDDIKTIQSDLDFWKEELSLERNRQQPQHHLLKRKTKKRSDIKAEQLILEYINNVIENPKLSTIATGPAITKEDTAYTLGLPVSQVEKIFMKLNLKGILSQRNHRYVHDTNRNPIFGGHDSGWASDYYRILDKTVHDNDSGKEISL